jgi:hypothetical protein
MDSNWDGEQRLGEQLGDRAPGRTASELGCGASETGCGATGWTVTGMVGKRMKVFCLVRRRPKPSGPSEVPGAGRVNPSRVNRRAADHEI